MEPSSLIKTIKVGAVYRQIKANSFFIVLGLEENGYGFFDCYLIGLIAGKEVPFKYFYHLKSFFVEHEEI